MGVLEISMIAAGAVIFLISFCIPVKEEKLKKETMNLAASEIRKLVEVELGAVRDRLSEISEEELKEKLGQSERTMERISNEKIMAVNEYSDTVLAEIHKNHEEVVFLYDILKNKKQALSESYGKVDQDIQKLLQEMKDSEITVKEKLEEISGKMEEFEGMAGGIFEKVRELEEMSEDISGKMEEFREMTEDISGKMRDMEEMRAQFPADTGGAQDEPVPVEDTQKEEEEVSPVRELVFEKAPEELSKAPAEKTFKPFTPEKVAVVPKKAAPKKAERKPEKKAAPPAEDRELKLLLSDTADGETGNNRNSRILKLHGQGKSNMAIARELGLGIGEVQLVIDLYEGMGIRTS